MVPTAGYSTIGRDMTVVSHDSTVELVGDESRRRVVGQRYRPTCVGIHRPDRRFYVRELPGELTDDEKVALSSRCLRWAWSGSRRSPRDLHAGVPDDVRQVGTQPTAARCTDPLVNSPLNACREYVRGVQDRAVLAEIAMLRRRSHTGDTSDAALEVHIRAVARSVRTECPAYVGYADLDAVAPGPITSLAALELCFADLWHDARGGYVVTDNELIARLSAGPVDLWFRRAIRNLIHTTLRVARKVWQALNEERSYRSSAAGAGQDH